MSEHDVPAECGRDELREKIEYALERCARYGYRSVGVGLTADDARRILALLAPQEVARDAGDAVWDAQNARLERMLEAAR